MARNVLQKSLLCLLYVTIIRNVRAIRRACIVISFRTTFYFTLCENGKFSGLCVSRNSKFHFRLWCFFCRLKVAEKYTLFSASPDGSRHRITKRNDCEDHQHFTEIDSYTFTKIVNSESIIGTLIENRVRLKNHI